MSELATVQGITQAQDPSDSYGDTIVPRSDYDLSAEQMDLLEAELWAEIKDQIPADNNGIAVAAVEWNSRYAAFGRSSETPHYEEEGKYNLHVGMIPYEEKSLFLYTFDTESGAIAHVKRVVFARSDEEILATGLTGIEVIDDRITSPGEEHADLEDIMEFHGIDSMGQVLNVASNHIMIRPGTKKGMLYTEASYKAVFSIVESKGMDTVVAYLNQAAVDSFAGLGLEYDPLGGKNYHVPNNEFDPQNPEDAEQFLSDYVAVCIRRTPTNVEFFQTLGEIFPQTDAPIISVS